MTRIGFLAGTFDLIHPGYIKMFKDARKVCDHLIVGLHDDPSLERESKLKPIHTLVERFEILSSIKYIGTVLFYSTEQDLRCLMENLPIDIRILGDDYKDKKYTGDDLDIEIYFHKRDHQYSRTNLVNKIKEL